VIIRGPWPPSEPTRLERELRASLDRLEHLSTCNEVPAAPAAESNEVPMSDSLARVPPSQFNIAINSLTEAMEVATLLSKSVFVPESYRGDPGAVFAAMMMAAELRIGIMQALQGIAVINGKPSVWGDLALALCQVHPEFDGHVEVMSADGTAARCTMKRKGRPEVVRTFTMQDAADAKLLTKSGPWQTARKRMLQMRARAYAMRDQFADALRGIGIREETQDYVVDAIVASSTVANDTVTAPSTVVSAVEAAEIKAAPSKPQPVAAPAPALTAQAVVVQQRAADGAFVIPNGKNKNRKMGDMIDEAIRWYADECKDGTIKAAATEVRLARIAAGQWSLELPGGYAAATGAVARAQAAVEASGYDPETGEVTL